MKTTHKVYFQNSQSLCNLENESIHLVITSPLYPMVKMWDDNFSLLNPKIKLALKAQNGKEAFELMHKELDKVWNEVYRVLKPGSIVCINIGDATRSIGGDFSLFPSHSRIIFHCCEIGFSCLPHIIWNKQTNAPNKFMGSGMLPPGGYITLEHEFILIFRKGGKREFKTIEEKRERFLSPYFWEERNMWFSNIWDLRGVHQSLKNNKVRARSAAFPFDLAYRLINMFSLKGDTVLDPFLGTGTTTLTAMASARNSVGMEIEENFREIIQEGIANIVEYANQYNEERIQRHIEYVSKRNENQNKIKYINKHYGFPVITKQELEFKLNILKEVRIDEDSFEVEYVD
ncbi:MAG: site-specific DNA-methyltransferase [Candidatus Heimdallarchaeota archaeon]|nr:site-specific DNA-methyltransferase [Candidatus Heimdallarchaeota archaeon]